MPLLSLNQPKCTVLVNRHNLRFLVKISYREIFILKCKNRTSTIKTHFKNSELIYLRFELLQSNSRNLTDLQVNICDI